MGGLEKRGEESVTHRLRQDVILHGMGLALNFKNK